MSAKVSWETIINILRQVSSQNTLCGHTTGCSSWSNFILCQTIKVKQTSCLLDLWGQSVHGYSTYTHIHTASTYIIHYSFKHILFMSYHMAPMFYKKRTFGKSFVTGSEGMKFCWYVCDSYSVYYFLKLYNSI